MAKRIFDLFLSLLGLFFLLPFWVLCSFAIWLEDGRPILYLQKRVGKDAQIFQAIKFRTLFYKKENSRLARFLRKTALDEVPQLINILKGEMSLVGPRPLIPEESEIGERLNSPGSYIEGRGLRAVVRPGLTGIAQVLAPKNAPLEEKLKYDLWYIENRSLLLDILLILKSFWLSLNSRWDLAGKPNHK